MEKHLASFRQQLEEPIDLGRVENPHWRQALIRSRLRLARLQGEEREKAIAGLYDVLNKQNAEIVQRSRARADDFIKRLRVLCLCADGDSERMWDEYGDRHRGCVLAFDPSVLETHWRVPVEPVVYGDRLPVLLNVEVHNRRLLGENVQFDPAESESMGRRWSLFKFEKYRHEQEWRFVAITDRGEYRGATDFFFPPAALVEIRFGRGCSEADRAKVERAEQRFRERGYKGAYSPPRALAGMTAVRWTR
jgi:hypothetical protein